MQVRVVPNSGWMAMRIAPKLWCCKNQAHDQQVLAPWEGPPQILHPWWLVHAPPKGQKESFAQAKQKILLSGPSRACLLLASPLASGYAACPADVDSTLQSAGRWPWCGRVKGLQVVCNKDRCVKWSWVSMEQRIRGNKYLVRKCM